MTQKSKNMIFITSLSQTPYSYQVFIVLHYLIYNLPMYDIVI
jgi:hypothetical protein